MYLCMESMCDAVTVLGFLKKVDENFVFHFSDILKFHKFRSYTTHRDA